MSIEVDLTIVREYIPWFLFHPFLIPLNDIILWLEQTLIQRRNICEDFESYER